MSATVETYRFCLCHPEVNGWQSLAVRGVVRAERRHDELAEQDDGADHPGFTTPLSRRHNPDAERFARRLTWALLALTVAGNAAHQGLAAAGMVPPWWVAVLVGAIPPGVVGAVVHVAVLVGRGTDNSESEPIPPTTEDAHPADALSDVPPWE